MPTINVAMERSLRRGFIELLAASIRPVFQRRDELQNIPNQINSVSTAFSSWGNCMQAVFCKWPVIAIIIVGGLIVLSVVWCIARCLCCGLSCCCECCQCLKCCGNCCGCCDPPRGTPHKHLDDSYGPPPGAAKQGYHAEAPMALPPSRVPASRAPEPPQYAEFDVSRKRNEDELPAMPDWENAGSKKIMVEEEDVEMDHLQKPENSGQNMPLMSGAGTSPGPASPSHSPGPYGAPHGAHDMYAASGGYVSAAGGSADPYAQSEQAYHRNPQGYGQSSSSLGTDPSYGVAGAAFGPGPGRRSPGDPQVQADYGNGGYGQAPANPRYPPSSRSPPGSYDGYGRPRQDSYDTYGQGAGPAGRGMGPSRRSPPRGPPGPNNVAGGGYPPEGSRRPPRPPPAGYGYGDYNNNNSPASYGAGPERQYSSESTRAFARPAQQQHEYSHDAPPASPLSMLNNSGGFDFNSGYSRPKTAGEEDDAAAGGRSNASQPQEAAAYPGYRAYRPSDNRRQDGWSGV